MRSLVLISAFLFTGLICFSQPDAGQNQMLATFGNMSDASCGDEDFSQTIFFAIPARQGESIYIRVFDPDCDGYFDWSSGLWETNTFFEVFGGTGCISELDARKAEPGGNYKSGLVLQRELFARESRMDGKWFSFGPVNTNEGEKLGAHPGYTFFLN